VVIRITNPDLDRDTGKTCLGGGLLSQWFYFYLQPIMRAQLSYWQTLFIITIQQ